MRLITTIIISGVQIVPQVLVRVPFSKVICSLFTRLRSLMSVLNVAKSSNKSLISQFMSDGTGISRSTRVRNVALLLLRLVSPESSQWHSFKFSFICFKKEYLQEAYIHVNRRFEPTLEVPCWNKDLHLWQVWEGIHEATDPEGTHEQALRTQTLCLYPFGLR